MLSRVIIIKSAQKGTFISQANLVLFQTLNEKDNFCCWGSVVQVHKKALEKSFNVFIGNTL